MGGELKQVATHYLYVTTLVEAMGTERDCAVMAAFSRLVSGHQCESNVEKSDRFGKSRIQECPNCYSENNPKRDEHFNQNLRVAHDNTQLAENLTCGSVYAWKPAVLSRLQRDHARIEEVAIDQEVQNCASQKIVHRRGFHLFLLFLWEQYTVTRNINFFECQ
jgi:hypothetical protein